MSTDTDLNNGDDVSRSGSRPEFSAGGVVVRGDELIVIVPTRRSAKDQQVLGLPKGHVESGEDAVAAAIREVREEAGVTARVVDSLGDVDYVYRWEGKRHAKHVEFFLMEYESGDPADHDHEVERAYWLSLERAVTEITYEGEREVVRRALSRRERDR
jgi:8-oxo-dGTP pyrophosphatase MutT (NUDIX family)